MLSISKGNNYFETMFECLSLHQIEAEINLHARAIKIFPNNHNIRLYIEICYNSKQSIQYNNSPTNH